MNKNIRQHALELIKEVKYNEYLKDFFKTMETLTDIQEYVEIFKQENKIKNMNTVKVAEKVYNYRKTFGSI